MQYAVTTSFGLDIRRIKDVYKGVIASVTIDIQDVIKITAFLKEDCNECYYLVWPIQSYPYDGLDVIRITDHKLYDKLLDAALESKDNQCSTVVIETDSDIRPIDESILYSKSNISPGVFSVSISPDYNSELRIDGLFIAQCEGNYHWFGEYHTLAGITKMQPFQFYESYVENLKDFIAEYIEEQLPSSKPDSRAEYQKSDLQESVISEQITNIDKCLEYLGDPSCNVTLTITRSKARLETLLSKDLYTVFRTALQDKRTKLEGQLETTKQMKLF